MKCDGYRAQAAIARDQVVIYSRGGHDWTRQFGYVAPALRRLTTGTALIDGEICAINAKGRSDFSLLKVSLDGKSPVVFFAFDLLEQDGEDVVRLPLIERKERLRALLADLPANSPIVYSDDVRGRGAEVYKAMCQGGFEGVIAKSPTARYYGGRSDLWLKVKCVQRQEFVVIGYRPPEQGRDDNVRALFLATYDDGQLVYRGAVGTGFKDRDRRDVWEVMQLIRSERQPVKGMPRPEARVCRWVQPRLLAEVEYTELTSDGTLRHPSFKGLRDDKDAHDVHLEEA